MSDNEAKVKITGDSSGAEAAMARAAVAVSSGTTTMRESMNALTSVFEGLQSKMLVVAGVLAGGKAFKESVAAVVELNSEALALGNALGISAGEANILNVALGSVFLDKDTYLTATRQITKELNKNEGAFQQLGVATRNAKNELLPTQEIITKSIEALKEFKAGTDRNSMAMQLFGKNYSEVMKLAKLTPEVMDEAKNKVAEFHMELNPAAVKAYRTAMHDVNEMFEAIKIAVGKTVMPIFTELAQWFASIGPAAIDIFYEAMNVLKIVFDTTKVVLVSLWDAFNGFFDFFLTALPKAFGGEQIEKLELFKNMVKVVELAFVALEYAVEQVVNGISNVLESLKTYLITWANVASKALSGDFKGAKQAWIDGLTDIENVIKKHGDKITELNKKYTEKAQDILMPSGKAASSSDDIVGGKGSKDAVELKQKKDPTKTKTKDWELEIQNTREAYELQNNLRKYDIQNEINYWQERLTQAAVGGQEYNEVMKKLNDAKLKQAQEAHKQGAELSAVEIDRAKSQGNIQLAIDEDNAKASLNLGKISNEQYLEQMQDFENRRYAIAKAAVEARMEMALKDPNSTPAEKAKINAELEALDGEHARNLNQINIEKVTESQILFTQLSESMGSLWDKGLQSMMNGTLKWSNAYKAVLASVGKVFANFALQKAKKWLQTEVMQTVYTKVQTAVRGMLEKMGLVKSVAATATAAETKVGANAVVAGSGAASAMAGIPYIGPILAIAAMAAMIAAVGGMKGSISSARGGYDIPAGVNPMVQLHEQEMVLPMAQANAIRDMANGGGGGGSPMHVTIHAMDSQSIKKLLMDNGHHVADALRQQLRNGGSLK